MVTPVRTLEQQQLFHRFSLYLKTGARAWIAVLPDKIDKSTIIQSFSIYFFLSIPRPTIFHLGKEAIRKALNTLDRN